MNTNFNPLVSICIPAFNGGDFIHRAIESAIHQSYKNIEVIVTDDASNDKTEEITRQYVARDKRLKYFRNTFNVGGQRNFFKAVGLASGEYIQGLCQDDWLSENYIEEGVENFRLRPRSAAVFSSVIHFDLINNNIFRPQNVFIPGTKNYPVEFFFKDGYKSQLASFGGLALYRRRDLIDIKSFMIEVLRKFGYSKARESGFWGEVLIPLKILSKYHHFACTNNSVYVKVEHFDNYAKQVKLSRDISEIAAQSVAIRELYERIYKNELKKFLLRFRVDFGVREINNALVSLLRRKFGNVSLRDFVRGGVFFMVMDYSPFEKILVAMSIPLLLFVRFLKFIGRMIKKLKLFKEKKGFSSDYSKLFLNKNNDTTYSFTFKSK